MQPTIDLKSIHALSFYDVLLCICAFDSIFHSSITQFRLLEECFFIMVERFLVLGREAVSLGYFVFLYFSPFWAFFCGFLFGFFSFPSAFSICP